MADFNTTADRALDWEDEIENDGRPFTVIPEGDYHFRVLSFERGRHDGSAKIPPCPKAIVTLSILPPDFPFNNTPLGEVEAHLFLTQKFEWKLCQFFTSIGLRKHGEKLKMNWNKVPYSEGDCHVGIRKWTDRNDKERESNEVTEFYDPEKSPLKMGNMDDSDISGASFTPGQF